MQIVYYDGQFDDSRLNASLACTAALAGAAVLNYAEVTELLKVRPSCLSMLVMDSHFLIFRRASDYSAVQAMSACIYCICAYDSCIIVSSQGLLRLHRMMKGRS